MTWDRDRVTYLSVRNFWKYQNADVWKKSKGHPPWCKLFVHRDREMDKLPVHVRLLWFELLGVATRYGNVLEADLSESEADLSWICSETRLRPEQVSEGLTLLLKGGWLSKTRTPRRSRKKSRDVRDGSLDLREEEKELNPLSPLNGKNHLKAVPTSSETCTDCEQPWLRAVGDRSIICPTCRPATVPHQRA